MFHILYRYSYSVVFLIKQKIIKTIIYNTIRITMESFKLYELFLLNIILYQRRIFYEPLPNYILLCLVFINIARVR